MSSFSMSGRSSGIATVAKFTSKEQELNPGLMIRRILPQVKCRSVGSFVFLDRFGPTTTAHMNVGPHPHIGLCTLTYLYSGSILHRDSTGAERPVRPEEVNWMCSGRGVTHSERSINVDDDDKPEMHGLQFWVALPKDQEEVEPSFHFSDSVVSVPTDDSSKHDDEVVKVNLVVGSAFWD
jgi:redox-sensitive bicupin YhaK (pirin superfamily)